MGCVSIFNLIFAKQLPFLPSRLGSIPKRKQKKKNKANIKRD